MRDSFEYWLARTLSFTQWEFLADHFAGPRPCRPQEERTRMKLVRHKLVRCYPIMAYQPTETHLTEKGHAVMCAALGMMADMLVATGYDGINNPVPQVTTIKKPMEKYGYGNAAKGPGYSPDGVLPAISQYKSG